MTRKEFISFLDDLRSALEDNPAALENKTIPQFLEAMASYTKDVQGFYDNMKISMNTDEASWENFKTNIKGSTIYE